MNYALGRVQETASGSHPRWGTPHLAFYWQAVLATTFLLLSQAGATVAGTYRIRISMSLISYFMPYLFTFAAALKVQGLPAPPDVIRPPGGRATAIVLAALGLGVTLAAMVLAVVPDPAETNPPLAIAKVVGSMVLLVGTGQVVYLRVVRRRRRAPA